jgi:hypothetical protein
MTDVEIQALLDSLASKIERLDVHREIAMLWVGIEERMRIEEGEWEQTCQLILRTSEPDHVLAVISF